MATAEMKVKVAVEKAMHNAFRTAAQDVWDEYGICIQRVEFSWIDVSTPGKPNLMLTDVRMDSLTKR